MNHAERLYEMQKMIEALQAKVHNKAGRKKYQDRNSKGKNFDALQMSHREPKTPY